LPPSINEKSPWLRAFMLEPGNKSDASLSDLNCKAKPLRSRPTHYEIVEGTILAGMSRPENVDLMGFDELSTSGQVAPDSHISAPLSPTWPPSRWRKRL
jgi:hypothetical protein